MKCEKLCLDCGKKINKVSIRCKSCANYNRKGKYKWSENAINNRKGERNPNWKDNVGYRGLHRWVRRNKPKPKLCEMCGLKPPFDVTNISGEYERNINDYKWLCRLCHMKDDGRLMKLIKRNKWS